MNDHAVVVRDGVRQLHLHAPANVKIVISMAGNGAEAIGELTRHGNASNTLLAHHLLYDQSALYSYLGFTTKEGASRVKPVSEETARRLAVIANKEALVLSDGKASRICGIGATSSLRKPEGERTGRAHVAYVAAHTWDQTFQTKLVFNPRIERVREEEEYINSLLILYMVALVRGVDTSPFSVLHLLRNDESIESVNVRPPDDVLNVYYGDTDWTFVGCDPPTGPCVVLPGSFNPLHEGHVGMATIAAKRTKLPVYFELAITNADKPPLDFIEIQRRIEQFKQRGLPVVVTNSPLFKQKVEVFPQGSVFALGVDTLRRIVDIRYYADSPAPAMELANVIARFMDRDNHFLCFARDCGGGKIETASEMPIDLSAIVDQVSPDEFLSPLSSTAARAGMRD